jgi:uncharacterized protein YegP (UPF0339 family)
MKALLKKSNAQEPYSFVFVDSGGNALVRSENYKARDSALKGIESVKKNCENDARYESKQAKNGKHFFNLKAANGQIVATSGMFASESERDNAIAALKKEAAKAQVEEQTSG